MKTKKNKTEPIENELYYNQKVVIKDNHGTIIFKQSGNPNPPPPKPPGGQ